MKYSVRPVFLILLLTLVTTAMTACSSTPKLLGNPEAPYPPSRAPEVGDILHTKTGVFVLV